MTTRRPAAVVTGAGATGDGIGNGRAAAILLAEAGHPVVVVDRRDDCGSRTADMIRERSGEAHAFPIDVTQADACGELAAFIRSEFGAARILVNNVGVGSEGSVIDTPPEQWSKVMRINVDSVYQVSRHLLPDMIDAGGGSIVNIGSISALRPRGLTAYSTSKGAVSALTEAMAVDHGSDGVRVNAVLPGPVWTPLVEATGADEATREQRVRASLLGVEGTGWDVGHAVAFLASDAARFITGQALVVDGGTILRSPAR